MGDKYELWLRNDLEEDALAVIWMVDDGRGGGRMQKVNLEKDPRSTGHLLSTG